mgnify:FL=1
MLKKLPIIVGGEIVGFALCELVNNKFLVRSAVAVFSGSVPSTT